MIKIGVTGGIGSGKSTISRLLEIIGIPVYIADEASKHLTNTSSVIKNALIKSFGTELYDNNGLLNKSLLASIIFSDKDKLQLVNSIIHPVVAKDFEQWTQQQSTCLVAMESAILFESGFDKHTDIVITVSCPLEIRIERIQLRDSLSRKQIIDRINNQLPEEEKCQRSDFVVFNDNIQALIPQLEEIVNKILK